MKIIESSATQLVLDDRPWIIGAALIVGTIAFLASGLFLMNSGEVFGGLMLIFVGGGVCLLLAAILVQRVRLTFDRSTCSITRIRRAAFGLKVTNYDLARLQRAVIVEHYDDGSTTYGMELVLTKPDEQVKFVIYSTSGNKPKQMCDAVNAWLGNTRAIDSTHKPN
jgi:hypothetical protein